MGRGEADFDLLGWCMRGWRWCGGEQEVRGKRNW